MFERILDVVDLSKKYFNGFVDLSELKKKIRPRIKKFIPVGKETNPDNRGFSYR
jgi:hypothetical protein